MEAITTISEFLKAHVDTLGILITLLGIFWASIQYLGIKRKENEAERFRTFHDLVRDLVQPPQNGAIFLDRQIAIIYELRHFPRYFHVSRRILKGLRATWAQPAIPDRLTREIELTLAFIEKRVHPEGSHDIP